MKPNRAVGKRKDEDAKNENRNKINKNKRKKAGTTKSSLNSLLCTLENKILNLTKKYYKIYYQ